jgi:hypothetical protein
MMKPGYFFWIALIFALLAILGMRNNISSVAEMADNIVQKDRAGIDVKADIDQLSRFVHKHTNSSVSFELEASYKRDLSLAQEEATENETGKLYQQAQASCDRPGVSSVVQAQCVQSYVNARLKPGQNPVPFQAPDKSLYAYSFVSPAWAPDMPGLFLLVSLVSAGISLLIYLKHLIRFENRNK